MPRSLHCSVGPFSVEKEFEEVRQCPCDDYTTQHSVCLSPWRLSEFTTRDDPNRASSSKQDLLIS